MTEQEALALLRADSVGWLNHPSECSFTRTDVLRVAMEALEEIQQYRATGLTPQMVYDTIKARNVAQKQAIENAHIVDDYSAIGTVEECRGAREKQIPKKPDLEGDGYADGHLVYDTWICPNCGVKYEVDYEEYDYCPDCGQHIDWTQEPEIETAPVAHGNIVYRNDIPHCSVCEKVIDANSCYCKWCGAKMDEEE